VSSEDDPGLIERNLEADREEKRKSRGSRIGKLLPRDHLKYAPVLPKK